MSEPYLSRAEAPTVATRLRQTYEFLSGSWPGTSYLAAGLLAVGVYFLLPGDVQSVLFVVVALSAAAALAIGARLHLTSNSLPWYLFAAGQLAFAGGDAIFGYYEIALGREPPFPSVADGVYLAGYPLLAAATYLLLRRLKEVEGHFALVDAATIAVGFGLVQWVFVIDPQVTDSGSAIETLALVAYPAMDVLLLGALARFFLAPAWRTPSYCYLVLAIALLLMADEVYAVAPEDYVAGGWVDALWLGSYVLWGAAALDPSMRSLSDPASGGDQPLSWSRLSLLTAALLASPTVLAIELEREARLQAFVAFAACAALGLLVLGRALGMDIYVFQRERVVRTQQEAIRRLSIRVRRVRDEILILDISGPFAPDDQLLASLPDGPMRAAVIDVEDVDKLDAKAAMAFRKLVDALRTRGMGIVVLVGAASDLLQRLAEAGLDVDALSVEPDLGSALDEAQELLRASQ